MARVEPSVADREFLAEIRASVSRFVARAALRFDVPGLVLDIAPHDQEGAAPHFRVAEVRTLDISREAGPDYVADICANNAALIRAETFDTVVCTEVLEHTLDPFAAVREIHRMLKSGGHLLVTTPFNFRIHGPLPDCWRFTEHGLRALLSGWDIVELNEVPTPGRPLMPIHYTVIARRR